MPLKEDRPSACPASALPIVQALAAEVVVLEEALLQAKSSLLRDKSQASGASEVARAMQARWAGTTRTALCT
jgi:hypothetical protein